MGWLVVLGETMKWVKCSERMPELDKWVMVHFKYTDNGHEVPFSFAFLWDENEGLRERSRKHKDKYPVSLAWEGLRYADECREVTHWMPLPRKPDEVD